MKKLLALVLALVMTLGLATVGANAFTDQTAVDESAYTDAITVLNGMKVFVGDENGNFNPSKTITRAEVAAIIYRIYTGDVNNSKVDNYKSLANFTDLAGAGWAAGYIGYCANAQFVKGYGDGTFRPSQPITGYEALTMILRAVGYDKNHEFEGAGYTIEVARVAQQLGLLQAVAAEDLSLGARRDAVAQILFSAIQVPTVTYTTAFGYNQYKTPNLMTDADKNNSLGWINFRLTKDDSSEVNDPWGRPQIIWYGEYSNGTAAVEHPTAAQIAAGTPANVYNNAKSNVTASVDAFYAKFNKDPLASYHTDTAMCKLFDDLGESRAQFAIGEKEIYNNGVAVGTTDYTANNAWPFYDRTDASIYTTTTTARSLRQDNNDFPANGVQVEFYDVSYRYPLAVGPVYRMVIVDTYLAEATTLEKDLLDDAGHVYTEAGVYMSAYANEDGNGRGTRATRKTTDLAIKGASVDADWVLVNISNNGAYTQTIKYKGTNVTLPYCEIVQAAEYIDGQQTLIMKDSFKHQVAGKTYDDAYSFYMDDAGDDLVYNARWFFDQFGYLIGDYETPKDEYAVLKSVRWIHSGTNDAGHAVATLVFPDGDEEKDVVLRHIDAFDVVTTDGRGNALTTVSQRANVSNWRTAGDIGKSATPVVGDMLNANPFISTNGNTIAVARMSEDAAIANTYYQGLALYHVRYYSDGSVDLEAWTDDVTANGYYDNGTTAATDETVVAYANFGALARNQALVGLGNRVINNAQGNINALFTVTTNSTAVSVSGDNGVQSSAIVLADETTVVLDNKTQFIVRNSDGTYSFYEGVNNLPAMQPNSVEMFYVASAYADTTAGPTARTAAGDAARMAKVASIVYIKSYVPGIQARDTHMFIPLDNNVAIEHVPGSTLSILKNVYVNGAKVDMAMTTAMAEDLYPAQRGKMFHINYESNNVTTLGVFGTLKTYDLVNEFTDQPEQLVNNTIEAQFACDYFADADFVTSSRLTSDNGVTYGITADTAVYGTPKAGADTKTGYWVIYDSRPGATFMQASSVYVGVELSDVATIKMTGTADAGKTVFWAGTDTNVATEGTARAQTRFNNDGTVQTIAGVIPMTFKVTTGTTLADLATITWETTDKNARLGVIPGLTANATADRRDGFDHQQTPAPASFADGADNVLPYGMGDAVTADGIDGWYKVPGTIKYGYANGNNNVFSYADRDEALTNANIDAYIATRANLDGDAPDYTADDVNTIFAVISESGKVIRYYDIVVKAATAPTLESIALDTQTIAGDMLPTAIYKTGALNDAGAANAIDGGNQFSTTNNLDKCQVWDIPLQQVGQLVDTLVTAKNDATKVEFAWFAGQTNDNVGQRETQWTAAKNAELGRYVVSPSNSKDYQANMTNLSVQPTVGGYLYIKVTGEDGVTTAYYVIHLNPDVNAAGWAAAGGNAGNNGTNNPTTALGLTPLAPVSTTGVGLKDLLFTKADGAEVTVGDLTNDQVMDLLEAAGATNVSNSGTAFTYTYNGREYTAADVDALNLTQVWTIKVDGEVKAYHDGAAAAKEYNADGTEIAAFAVNGDGTGALVNNGTTTAYATYTAAATADNNTKKNIEITTGYVTVTGATPTYLPVNTTGATITVADADHYKVTDSDDTVLLANGAGTTLTVNTGVKNITASKLIAVTLTKAVAAATAGGANADKLTLTYTVGGEEVTFGATEATKVVYIAANEKFTVTATSITGFATTDAGDTLTVKTTAGTLTCSNITGHEAAQVTPDMANKKITYADNLSGAGITATFEITVSADATISLEYANN